MQQKLGTFWLKKINLWTWKIKLKNHNFLGITTKSAKGTTLTTATSFLTGSKENLNSIRTNKIGKSPSYSTLASSSVNLVNTRKNL